MKTASFENLTVWSKAQTITLEIYRVSAALEDHSYTDQLQHACTSIMNNIAKGFERQSSKDFIEFLDLAKGSCGEVRSMLMLGQSLKYLQNEISTKLIDEATEISKMLSGLINTLRRSLYEF